jgi:hypothetical protein
MTTAGGLTWNLNTARPGILLPDRTLIIAFVAVIDMTILILPTVILVARSTIRHY